MIERFAPSEVALFVACAVVLLVGVVLLRALRRSQRSARRRQVAAIPVRIGARGALEVLVISTRGSGRWTVPKGWPMRGRSDSDAAAREAYEEAGVRGVVRPKPVGTFDYTKRRTKRDTLTVVVYRLDVTSHARDWRERNQRRQRWLSVPAAADCVAWPGLADVIRSVEDDSRTPS